MAEFTYNPIQLVEPGQNVILNTTIRCGRGYVLHRDESGIVILRGIVNNVLWVLCKISGYFQWQYSSTRRRYCWTD